MEGTRARVRVLERFQQRLSTEGDPNPEADADAEQPRCEQNYPEPGSSTESARGHHQTLEVKPSPRRRPSRIPLPRATKAAAPKPPTTHGRNDSKESLKSLTTRTTRDSSRDSLTGKTFSSKTRDTKLPGSSTESARDHHQTLEVKPSPRRRPSRIPLPRPAKAATPKPPTTHGRKTTRDSKRDSLTSKTFSSKTRDTSRESLNKSLSRTSERTNETTNKKAEGDTLHKSLPRNNSSKDSLYKSSLLSRARDSLESNHLGSSSPVTPPRRLSAPARRSHSLARASVDTDTGKVRPVNLSFWQLLKSPLSNGPT